jgi:hypothetical protein
MKIARRKEQSGKSKSETKQEAAKYVIFPYPLNPDVRFLNGI